MTWTDPLFTSYIKPVGVNPEGFDVALYLQELLYRVGVLPPEDAYREVILDMFCGKGRLTPCVPARHARVYRGVDINEAAIAEAKRANPGYTFAVQDGTERVWKAKAILLWTAISMLDDTALPPFLALLDASYIIVGEILGRDWRATPTSVHPGIYNRDFGETVEAFAAAGYELAHHECIPHAHYSDGHWLRMHDTAVHVFVFRKDDSWQFYKDARDAR